MKNILNKTTFDLKAATWDENTRRVRLAMDVADTMIQEIRLSQKMDVLDFGCGTGLVTLQLQPLVKHITGADNSSVMLEMLREKIRQQALTNVDTLWVDISRGDQIKGQYHLIVSSMTFHHLPDIPAALLHFHKILHPGGMVAIADLDQEDGSFHEDPTGVQHHGFDREFMREQFEQTGYTDIRTVTGALVEKEQLYGNYRRYSVFLIIAKKPSH